MWEATIESLIGVLIICSLDKYDSTYPLYSGRVQSAALRLVCEREAAIEAFTAREYWTVQATLQTASGATFQVLLCLLMT